MNLFDPSPFDSKFSHWWYATAILGIAACITAIQWPIVGGILGVAAVLANGRQTHFAKRAEDIRANNQALMDDASMWAVSNTPVGFGS